MFLQVAMYLAVTNKKKLAELIVLKGDQFLLNFGGNFDGRNTGDIFLIRLFTLQVYLQISMIIVTKCIMTRKSRYSCSNMIHRHILRSEYVFNASHLLENCNEFLLSWLNYVFIKRLR